MLVVDQVDIRLHFEPRPDGGLRVRSPDEPGLILGGPDPERTRSFIPLALKSLLEHDRRVVVHGLEVRGDHVHVTFSKAACPLFFVVEREEALRRLAAAGFRQGGNLHPALERWYSPGGFEFTLELEPFEEVALENVLELP